MTTSYDKILRDTFYYCGGKLYYKTDRGKRKAGEVAGSKSSKFPYRKISVDGKKFLEHRVIFFLCEGYWPEFVDHINNDKLDNRIENLREATLNQNAYNRATKPSGVRLHSCGKWEAYVTPNRSFRSLGYFNCETAAKISSAREKVKISEGFYSPFKEG